MMKGNPLIKTRVQIFKNALYIVADKQKANTNLLAKAVDSCYIQLKVIDFVVHICVCCKLPRKE